MTPFYGGLSQHSTDRLIRDLLHSGRIATGEEIDQIVRHMAGASFPSETAHRNRRTAEQQWADVTTVGQYVDDLRRAIVDPAARMAIYMRRGGHMAAALTDTARIVPEERRGANAALLLFVAYSADRGILVTGYQASSLHSISLPGGVQWLK